MKKLLLLGFFAFFLSSIIRAQNEFPLTTGSNVILDGGYIKMIKPVGAGGWARGFLYYKTINESAWAGIGLHGTGESVNSIYLAHGNGPWTSNKGVYILPSGFTGIGINSPTSMLDVKGVLSINQRSENGHPRLVFAHNNIGSDNWIQMDRNTDFMNIRVGGVDVINISGTNQFVGIGTTNPTELLTVKGKILAGEVQIENVSSIPDYVFEEDYNLRSIEEVDAYIKEAKHLPDVPSASELEENGYNIGDMNNILLKKVEELTLYMIDMKKSLNEKDAQIKELQEKVEQLEKSE